MPNEFGRSSCDAICTYGETIQFFPRCKILELVVTVGRVSSELIGSLYLMWRVTGSRFKL